MTFAEKRERRKAMVHMLKAGKTVREVAKMFGVTEALVYLARKGETMPPRKINPRLQVISDLSVKGMTQTEIASVIGVTRARVNQLAAAVIASGLPFMRRQDVPTEKKTCMCGRSFTVPVHNAALMGRKFCSQRCRLKHMTYRSGGPSSRKEVVTLKCAGCGEKFERTKRLMYITEKSAGYRGKTVSDRKYCTQQCYLNHRYGGDR